MTDDDDLKSLSQGDLLLRIAQELKLLRQHSTTFIMALRDAESEIPEKLRRFMNYCHDIHAMKFMYEEVGHQAPPWVMRELERVDDRYKQIMTEMKAEGGPINKVIREMSKDPTNRWDHMKQLPKPTEKADATGPSDDIEHGLDESGTSADES